MIDEARLSILAGGYHRDSPATDLNEHNAEFDHTFAYYLTTSGEAVFETVEGKWTLEAGHVHFIPVHYMIRRSCEKEMWKYWVLFTSTSFHLNRRLLAIRSVHRWPLAGMPSVRGVFERFPEFFGDPGPRPDLPRKDAHPGLALQIDAMLLYLTGLLVEATEADFHYGGEAELERLKPAIDFMDAHFLSNPTLAQIADCIHIDPSYFHRLFKRQTGLTPFRYMENRRLDVARKLIFDGRMNITEVAQRSGYESVYYFSRAFRRRFGIPPSHLRQWT